MSTEMTYLAWTALLTAALWIPYVIAQVTTNGPLQGGNYRDPTPRPVPLWGQRANRAHVNAVESFAPYAALLLIVQVTGKADAMTAFWAGFYFWCRLGHAVIYLIGVPYLRTLIFTAGFVAVVGLFVAVMR